MEALSLLVFLISVAIFVSIVVYELLNAKKKGILDFIWLAVVHFVIMMPLLIIIGKLLFLIGLFNLGSFRDFHSFYSSDSIPFDNVTYHPFEIIIIYIISIFIVSSIVLIGGIIAFIVYATTVIQFIDIMDKYIILMFDNLFYNKLYKLLNGIPKSYIYEKNYKYNDSICFKCNICLKTFNKSYYGQEVILSCGHIFHNKCIRKCELYQYFNDTIECRSYKCPIKRCDNCYNWREKWNYIHIDYLLFDKIRDDTLLKYIPNPIEDIIISYI